MRRTLCVALAGLILSGACGDDDDDSTDSASSSQTDADADAYIEAAVTSIGADDGGALAGDAATCIATATVESIGVDTFVDAGITPDELAEADDIGALDLDVPDNTEADLAAALEGCELGDAFATLLVAGFADVTGETPEGAQECLADNFDNAELAALAAEGTLSPTDEEDADLNALMASALGACPDALSQLLEGSFEAGLGTELSPESSDCMRSFVEADPQGVAEGFMSSDEDGADIIGTDLMAACPTLAAEVSATTTTP